MMSMSADVHDRAQHDTKKFICKKNELSLVNTTVVFTGMEARLLSSN